jgi:sulfite reductase (NADPH) hemoprotein beta-component
MVRCPTTTRNNGWLICDPNADITATYIERGLMTQVPSPNERIKTQSNHLRGTLADSLNDELTAGLRPDDQVVIKFHGSYQQDDRDIREERRLQKLEPAHDFMIRTRLPGGVCTPTQWLALDDIATRYGNNSLRLTTRQTFQLHGVIKNNLKTTMAAINATMIDTIAACGDVNRNVICNPNPFASELHAQVLPWAIQLSEAFLPKSRAYYELWLDEEKVAGGEDEPLYGETYLPRKFKMAVAIPPSNDVDVHAHCLGFTAIAAGEKLIGFNVSVGGGMGATHGDASTTPRLADTIGFCTPENMIAVAESVLTIQRDFGNRIERKHARLKYTIAHRGVDWFIKELHCRLGFELAPAQAVVFSHNGDRFGWTNGTHNKHHLTLHLDSGRIAGAAREGLRAIAAIHQGDFRLTANQNVIVANVDPEHRGQIDKLAADYGLNSYTRLLPVRLAALACVALPTCSLAMAEAERYMPTFVDKFAGVLAKHNMQQLPVNIRITGCPNGCARPYVAEIALIGKAPGRYNLMAGGNSSGTRLARLWRENIDEDAILATLDRAVGDFVAHRSGDESFGDYADRKLSEVSGWD